MQSQAIIKVNDWDDLNNSLNSNLFTEALTGLPAVQLIKKKAQNFKDIHPQGTVWLCFVPLGKAEYDVTMITDLDDKDIKIDSLRQKNISIRDYEGTAISTLEENGNTMHFIRWGKTFMGSTSSLLLENAIRNKEQKDYLPEEFNKIESSADNGALANIFMPGDRAANLFNELFPHEKGMLNNRFSWVGLDLYDKDSSIQLNGVLLPGEDNKKTLALLRGVRPTSIKIASILPSAALGSYSFNYDNWAQYKQNLAAYRGLQLGQLQLAEEDLLSNATEISTLYLNDGKVTALAFPDVEASMEFIAPILEEDETFRETPIYKLQDSTFMHDAFKEIMNPPTVSYMCSTDDYMAFAKSKTILKTFITNIKNNSYLEHQSNFENLQPHLASQTSLQFFGNTDQLLGRLRESVSAEAQPELEKLNLESYPFGVIQLTEENGFMHINALARRNTIKPQAGAVSQLASIKLDAALAIPPQFVTNHRTKGSDIVVQDVDNTLYLISNKGKILWKKQLKDRVLGKIQQIDLYKNGRLQLVFTTPSSLQVIDREGNAVKPYPIDFKDKVTQPLALFDYDGTRRYRLVVVQGDNLLMYNSDAKIVNGFKYTDAPGAFLFPPKHIRIGTKDYIVAQLANGGLKILDRTGDVRIKVDDKFDFGNTSVQQENKGFSLYDINANHFTISESGKIKKENTGLSNELQHTSTSSTTALLAGNQLNINGNTTELDFGLYTGLKIEKVGKNEIILLMDDQSKQVYAFDSKGKLLDNFPIYGTSPASLDYLEKNKNIGIVVQGEPDTVLLYQLNQ